MEPLPYNACCPRHFRTQYENEHEPVEPASDEAPGPSECHLHIGGEGATGGASGAEFTQHLHGEHHDDACCDIGDENSGACGMDALAGT